MRFLEFFAADIGSPHTRRRSSWPGAVAAAVPSIAAVQPVHAATWIEAAIRELSAPSVKQRLAAIHHLFDWLVTGQLVTSTLRGRCAGRATSQRRAKRRCLIPPKHGCCSTASTLPPTRDCAIEH